MDYDDLLISANKRVGDYLQFRDLGMLSSTNDFVPAVHYPPITKYPSISCEEVFKGYTVPADGLLDIYVHFPFCTKKCDFCHYPSLYGKFEAEKDKYIGALEKEIDIYLNQLGIDKLKPRSILIGGGTPTDLSPKQLERFLKIFTSKSDFSKLKQFNYDVSPSSIIGEEGREKLRIMRDYGVDRLTIGIQSMNEDIINKMNRSHDKAGALESIKNTLEFGYQLDIEFIFGYPGQTLKSWYEELKEIVTLDAHEIQFYRLKVSAYGDQQGSIKKKVSSEFPSVEDTIRMKQMNIDYLRSYGYNENLRRVFTKKKSDLSLYAYNQCCALYDQIAFGLTGFSSLRDRFILNTQYFKEYYENIEKGILPLNRGYVRDYDAQLRWAIILPLKTYFIRKKFFKEFTGVDIKETPYYKLLDYLKTFDLICEDEHRISLTEKGSFFADEVCQLFYAKEFIPFAQNEYNQGVLNPYTINSK